MLVNYKLCTVMYCMITADLRKINGMRGSIILLYRPFKLKRPVIFAEKNEVALGRI